MMNTVSTFAAGTPHVWASTSDATDVLCVICCHGSVPSTPTCNNRYSTMIPTIEWMIARGSVRPGSRISAPR